MCLELLVCWIGGDLVDGNGWTEVKKRRCAMRCVILLSNVMDLGCSGQTDLTGGSLNEFVHSSDVLICFLAGLGLLMYMKCIVNR